MTKRFNSKFKYCKNIKGKYKNIWGVVKSTKFRSIKILKQNIFNVKQKLNRLSTFGKYLTIKQLFKGFYANISQRHFKFLLNNSISAKANCLDKFVSLLESRLDIVIYRGNFVNSLYMARQLINHRFVYLNAKQISFYRLLLKPGDLIELKSINKNFKYKSLELLKQRCFKQHYNFNCTKYSQNLNKIKLVIRLLNKLNRNMTKLCCSILAPNLIKLCKVNIIPSHLENNFFLFKIIFLWDPVLRNTYYPIKMKYKTHFNSNLYSNNELLYKC